MDKSQKHKIVYYLKTVYQGVPLKKLFKRCQHQMELCEKSLMESEISGSLVTKKQSFKKPLATCIKGKFASLPLYYTLNVCSRGKYCSSVFPRVSMFLETKSK